MFDQAFDPAQAFGQRENWQRSRNLAAAMPPSSTAEIMPPKPSSAAAQGRVADGSSGPDSGPRARRAGLPATRRYAARSRSAAPCGARASSVRAGPESCQGSGDAADGVLQETSRSAKRRILAHHGDAADHIGMAVKVLGDRVDDDVEPSASGRWQ